MKLRAYTEDYLDDTRSVFRRAVSMIASRDYTPKQVEAWLAGADNALAWHKARSARQTMLALKDGKIVGFIDVDSCGHIDMLFVEPEASRMGVATVLLDWVIRTAQESNIPELSVHASITARYFFEARGFSVVKERHPIVRGVKFTNYLMRLTLAPR